MKKYDIYTSLFWVSIAVFVCILAMQLGLGSFRYPGPGFFPFLVSIVLFLFSSGVIVMAMKERHQDPTFKELPSFSIRVATTLLVLFIFAILLEFLGFILALFLLMLYLFKFPGSGKWWFSTTAATIFVLFVYYFFGVLLKSQLPKGILGI